MKILFGCLFLIAVVSGCTTKSKSRAQAQAAFVAGQQQALTQMQQQKTPTVKVIGSVQNETVPWTENLTLAQAIVIAEYKSAIDPHTISIVRNGLMIPVDPKQLIRGKDIPLQAGDVIEIR